MEAVGIRELKAHLSDYVRRAKQGEGVVITERGVEVAELRPLSSERRWLQGLVEEGGMLWDGGKPKGCQGVRLPGRPVSEIILEDRR